MNIGISRCCKTSNAGGNDGSLLIAAMYGKAWVRFWLTVIKRFLISLVPDPSLSSWTYLRFCILAISVEPTFLAIKKESDVGVTRIRVCCSHVLMHFWQVVERAFIIAEICVAWHIIPIPVGLPRNFSDQRENPKYMGITLSLAWQYEEVQVMYVCVGCTTLSEPLIMNWKLLMSIFTRWRTLYLTKVCDILAPQITTYGRKMKSISNRRYHRITQEFCGHFLCQCC